MASPLFVGALHPPLDAEIMTIADRPSALHLTIDFSDDIMITEV
jgi:hypothetical protein